MCSYFENEVFEKNRKLTTLGLVHYLELTEFLEMDRLSLSSSPEMQGLLNALKLRMIGD